MAQKDDCVVVRDSAMFAIARILQASPNLVLSQPATMTSVLTALHAGITAEDRVTVQAGEVSPAAHFTLAVLLALPAVAGRMGSWRTPSPPPRALDMPSRQRPDICWLFPLDQGVCRIAVACGETDAKPLLTHVAPILLNALITRLATTTATNVGLACSEASSAILSNLPDDPNHAKADPPPGCATTLSIGTATVILPVLTAAVLASIQEDADSAAAKLAVSRQSICLPLLYAALDRLPRSNLAAIAAEVVGNVLTILSGPLTPESAGEDALLVLAKLIDGLGSGFEAYLGDATPVVIRAIKSVSDPAISTLALGTIGDLSRSCNILPHFQEIWTALWDVLQSDEADRSVKPALLSALGDVAVAIGQAFGPVFEATAALIRGAMEEAMANTADIDDPDDVDYITELRDGVLDAWTGLVQAGMAVQRPSESSVDPAVASFLAEIEILIEPIVGFVDAVRTDPSFSNRHLHSSLGLLGDICAAFGPKITDQELPAPFREAILAAGRRSDDQDTIRIAEYAEKKFRTITGGGGQ